MKKIVLSLIGLMSLLLSASAQNISITNNDTTICSGTFWDSGIEGNYEGGENETITICSNSGGAINFEFIAFSLGLYSDELSVYDGTSTQSDLIGVFDNDNSLEGLTISSTGTCLTFVFTSPSWAGGEEGWFATMTCSLPCQEFEVEVQTDLEVNDDGVYVMCPEDLIQFDVDISFPNNNEEYYQDITNTTFSWKNNNEWESTEQNASYSKSYNQVEALIFEVEDVNGCIVEKSFILKSECQIIESQILFNGATPENDELYVANGEEVQISILYNYPENGLCYSQENIENILNLGLIGESPYTNLYDISLVFPDNSMQILKLISFDELGCYSYDTLELHIGCQPIEVDFQSDQPSTNGAHIVCINDTFSIEAVTNYLYNDQIYNQEDNSTEFIWLSLGDTIATEQSINYSFSQKGYHPLRLDMIDVNNCLDRENLLIKVIDDQVAIDLDYLEDTICQGDSLSITANIEYQNINISEPVFIPDGYGVMYTSQMFINDYSGFISNEFGLESICINMEHSYAGDLKIDLICPTGQNVVLLDYPNGCTSNHFGEPVDNGGTNTIGNGYEYCFMEDEIYSIPESFELNHTYINNEGDTITNTYYPAGDYNLVGNLNDLDGCLVNGAWTLQITDNIGSDDGYIFYWTLGFSEELLVEDSGIWEGNWSVESDYPADFVSMNDSTLFIPQDTGSYYIHYELNSVAGCGVDTVIGPITVIGNMELLEIEGDNEVVNGDIVVYNLAIQSSNIIEWLVGGGTINEAYSGDSIQVEWTSEAGYVMVTAENMNGCTSTDVMYINSTDITENIKSEIKLYPNPSQGLITIEMESDKSKSFTLINANGAVVLQDRLEGRVTTINLSHLPTGMYLVLLDGQYAQKLILE